jgi:enamine deaminase RidA (YjgF/YER057c/UK114 family)
VIRLIDPSELGRFPHFSQGALVEGPGDILFIAGQTGSLGGEASADFDGQVTVVWRRIRVLLGEAGLGLSDVAKVTGYLTRRENVPAYRRAFMDVMAGHRPPSTLVICELVAPELLVEIEVVAVRATPK